MHTSVALLFWHLHKSLKKYFLPKIQLIPDFDSPNKNSITELTLMLRPDFSSLDFAQFKKPPPIHFSNDKMNESD